MKKIDEIIDKVRNFSAKVESVSRYIGKVAKWLAAIPKLGDEETE